MAKSIKLAKKEGKMRRRLPGTHGAGLKGKE
jgi:hypothetical protein